MDPIPFGEMPFSATMQEGEAWSFLTLIYNASFTPTGGLGLSEEWMGREKEGKLCLVYRKKKLKIRKKERNIRIQRFLKFSFENFKPNTKYRVNS